MDCKYLRSEFCASCLVKAQRWCCKMALWLQETCFSCGHWEDFKIRSNATQMSVSVDQFCFPYLSYFAGLFIHNSDKRNIKYACKYSTDVLLQLNFCVAVSWSSTDLLSSSGKDSDLFLNMLFFNVPQTF